MNTKTQKIFNKLTNLFAKSQKGFGFVPYTKKKKNDYLSFPFTVKAASDFQILSVGSSGNSPDIGAGVQASIKGITFTLDRNIGWPERTELILEISELFSRLAGKPAAELSFETQRPMAFTGGLAFSGLADQQRGLFVAGPELIPNKNLEQSSATKNLVNQLTGGKGIQNPSNKGKNPDLFQIGIYDSHLCALFLNAWKDSESPSMQKLKILVQDEEPKVAVNRIYFGLKLSSDIVDFAELSDKLREQAYIQNSHNLSLIPRDLLYNRKRGEEAMNTVYKRSRKNTSHTLIIGSTAQAEMLYVSSKVVAISRPFDLDFTYVGSKNKAKDILLDLTRDISLNKLNYVVAGYFFEYLSRVKRQEKTLFEKIYLTLDNLRVGDFSPRLRKPVFAVGDPTLNWVQRSLKGVLTNLENNISERTPNAPTYIDTVEQFVQIALKLLPVQSGIKAIDSFAEKNINLLGEKAQRSLAPLKNYTYQLTSFIEVPSPQEFLKMEKPGELADYLVNLISSSGASQISQLIYNLRLLVGIIENPLLFLPKKTLYLANTRFFRMLSRFFVTRQDAQQRFAYQVQATVEYLTTRVQRQNEQFVKVLRDEISFIPQFSFIRRVVTAVADYLKSERRGSQKRVDDALLTLFSEISPGFNQENYRQLLQDAYNLQIGPVEKVLGKSWVDVTDDELSNLEKFVINPFDSALGYVYENVVKLLITPPSELSGAALNNYFTNVDILSQLRVESIQCIRFSGFFWQDASADLPEDNPDKDSFFSKGELYLATADKLETFLIESDFFVEEGGLTNE